MAGEGRAKVRVGVAGWDYKDWEGVVYPVGRGADFDRLRYLAGFVDLIEVNSSFYGPPRQRVAERWASRVEDVDSFRFTAKLWRRFTHQRAEAWSRSEVDEVTSGLRPLLEAGRLDAVLAQFPWSFKNDDDSREWLEDVLSEFEAFPLVVEVRHESWNEREFYEWLAERGVGFVNVDQPLFKKSIRPSALSTSRVAYVRVHGRNYQDWFREGAGRDARYDYLYLPDELEPWVERTQELATSGDADRVDVVFNNHYKGQAVANALQFESLLAGRTVPAPEPLLRAFPEALDGFACEPPPGSAVA